MKTKPKRSKPRKFRNWIAVHAILRGGAGTHGDARKEASRRACRGQVREGCR